MNLVNLMISLFLFPGLALLYAKFPFVNIGKE